MTADARPSLVDRFFAWTLNALGPKAEWRFRDRKLRLFAPLRGTVVEVGIGTAPNLELYAARVNRVIGIDPNRAMARYARAAAAAAGCADKLELIAGRAEALPLEDGSADAVIMTHVLCSVSDQARALAEVRRVLKPGGRFLFLEHVAAPPGDRLRAVQRWADPVVGVMAHGCSCKRETLKAIQAAGFSAVDAERWQLELWYPLKVIAPHVSGAAVR